MMTAQRTIQSLVRTLLVTGLLLTALALAPSPSGHGAGPNLLSGVYACTGQGGGGEC